MSVSAQSEVDPTRGAVASSSFFPYTPIDTLKSEFRLLSLLPGEFDDPIKVNLEKACLKDEPNYNAVSYAWGTTQHKVPVIVNDLPFTVTTNLNCALQHLRYTDRAQTLWIDAICINQEDCLEKGAQVQLMGQVFFKADTVLVWLGPATDAADQLIRFCKAHEWFREYMLPLPDAVRVLPLIKEMTNQPWFQRIWVWQEFILARECDICYGRHRMMWDVLDRDFTRILIHIIHNDSPVMAMPYPPLKYLMKWFIPVEEQENFHEMSQGRLKLEAETCSRVLGRRSRAWRSRAWRSRASERYAQHTRNFAEQLVCTKDLSATDPRDKVFGILGIVVFKKRPVLPDYTKSTRLVYTEAMAAAIQEDLSWTYTNWSVAQKSRVLPSWVPDMDMKDYSWMKPHIMPKAVVIKGLLRSLSTYLPLADFSDDLRTLHAGGVMMGTVQTYSDSLELHFGHGYERNNVYYLGYASDLLEMAKDIPWKEVTSLRFGNNSCWPSQGLITGVTACPHAQSRRFGIAGTPNWPRRATEAPTCGRSAQGTAGSYGASHDVVRCPSPDRTALFVTDTGKICFPSPVRVQKVDIMTGFFDGSTQGGYMYIASEDVERRPSSDRIALFVTNTGKIGLTSPGRVQKGDIIAGLFGVNIPFVLRRRGQSERYEMMDVAQIGDHIMGHPEIPRDVEKADLYAKYGFRIFDID